MLFLIGEVFLRRLSWNKVWKLVKRGDGIKVTSMVWRPDSEVLAIGYSSGDVVLVDVETGETIHSFNPCGEAVTSLTWENSHSNPAQWLPDNPLPKLLPLPSKMNSASAEDSSNENDDKIKQENQFSLLWIGLTNGTIYGYAFGVFPCCLLKLSEFMGGNESVGPVRNICPNFDHSQLTLLADLCGSSEFLLLSIETPLVACCLKELHSLGTLYRQISVLMDYLDGAQKSLHEAWEDALVDLESKMARYESRGDSSLAVDLIELLMFGHAGIKLEKFLSSELTDKGLKRIGQAVELSYSNMQKLLINHIQCANYQLVSLRGNDWLSTIVWILNLLIFLCSVTTWPSCADWRSRTTVSILWVSVWVPAKRLTGLSDPSHPKRSNWCRSSKDLWNIWKLSSDGYTLLYCGYQTKLLHRNWPAARSKTFASSPTSWPKTSKRTAKFGWTESVSTCATSRSVSSPTPRIGRGICWWSLCPAWTPLFSKKSIYSNHEPICRSSKSSAKWKLASRPLSRPSPHRSADQLSCLSTSPSV